MLESIFLNNFFAFLIVTVIIVVVHEYGHYFFAKLCGVHIDVFSVGFGPKLFSFYDKAKTRWQICALPFGGFVKINGQEASFDESEAAKVSKDDKTNFINKNSLQKISIAFAGPLFNMILAVVIIFTIFISYGKPQIQPVISEILPNSVAEKYGLIVNDRILKINNIDVKSSEDMLNELQQAENNIANLVVQNKDEGQRELQVILGDDHKLGVKIGGEISTQKVGIKESFSESIKYTFQITKMSILGIKRLIFGEEKMKNLGGIIQIAKSSGDAMRSGFESFLFLIALLSINLAILNLLPIPGLDGGHILFYIFDLLWIGKLIKPKVRIYAVACGFILLIGLMIVANSNDIIKLINKTQ